MLKDLRRIAYVVEVARAGSFTGAARALGVAQSTITKGIAEVEAQTGTSLFVRTSTGANTTEAGQRFVSSAQTLLRDANSLFEESQSWSKLAAGHLRIAVSPLASLRFVRRAIESFCGTYPLVKISFEPIAEATAVPRMLAGDLDLVIAAERSLARWKDLRRRVICPLDCAFFVRRGHPLARGAATERNILELPMVVPVTADPLLSDMAIRATAHNLAGLKQHYRCDDFETITAIVRSTDACSPLLLPGGSRDMLRDEFCVFHNVVRMPQQRLLAAQPKNRKTSPAAREMLRCIGDHAVK